MAWARKYGIQSTIHTGGPSIPGSSLIDKDMVLETDADVIGHVNGGHTALPDDQIVALCERSPRALEIVHNGNERAGLLALRTAKELNQLHRVILGTDSPAGSGVQPLGILRMISMLSSLGEIPAEVAICLATGNTAKMRSLNCGLIAAGREATFVFLDTAQQSAGKNLLDSIQKGDLAGIGMVITDGAVSIQRSRNTPPATRVPEVVYAYTHNDSRGVVHHAVDVTARASADPGLVPRPPAPRIQVSRTRPCLRPLVRGLQTRFRRFRHLRTASS